MDCGRIHRLGRPHLTLPLAALAAIELPFEAGRKVAVVATIKVWNPAMMSELPNAAHTEGNWTPPTETNPAFFRTASLKLRSVIKLKLRR